MNTLQLPKLIAITGKEASGKDAYGAFLQDNGYLHIAAGDVIRERARSLGHVDPISRAILSQVGDIMKQEFGPSPITQSSVAKHELLKDQFPAGLAVSGLRRVGELQAFKQQGAFALWIEASDTMRFENQNKRARGDQQTFEDFMLRGDLEYHGMTEGGSNGVNLQAIEVLADCRVVNDGTIDMLYQKANNVLTTMRRS